ncbi:MAG: ubiquinone/menaquinone biosynthesis methyltransferase [Deltaproteobacteria bacterium]|nr:ubiquinone/menaquinone biosynthesis methyltransferase [Deltaproteobacteria bacterium]MBW2120303.1 ubiquinone/menaquinone biosynthesis methyltransferase [Deltaproteobacteria bacterium]
MKDRERFVRSIFTRLPPSYHLLNGLLSFGWDLCRGRLTVRRLLENKGGLFLDTVTGTCEGTRELLGADDTARVLAIDFSSSMLVRGKAKIARLFQTDRAQFALADGLYLPSRGEAFDGIMIAFVIRNIEQRGKALQEAAAVLKPGGLLAILEFTVPDDHWFWSIYRFYLRGVLPRLGDPLSHNRSAYQYLSDSIMGFPRPKAFLKAVERAGFTAVHYCPLTLGIVGVYTGMQH